MDGPTFRFTSSWAAISLSMKVNRCWLKVQFQKLFLVGRGWSRIGENTGDFTNQAINIGFLILSSTVDGWAWLDSLIDCGIREGHLTQNVNVVAQCQVTDFISCSASGVYAWISGHPRFIENPQRI